jgi:hypothetical protein
VEVHRHVVVAEWAGNVDVIVAKQVRDAVHGEPRDMDIVNRAAESATLRW